MSTKIITTSNSFAVMDPAKILSESVADPGFPVVGARTRWGGTNLQRIHFSAKTYVKTNAKMKEIDPVAGGGTPVVPPLDPPM